LDGGRLLQQGAPSQILDRPASVRVAAILGKSNVLQAEVVALDPGRNYSRLRCLPDGSTAVEAEGPYLPGCLLGDRMHIAVRADSIVAQPRSQGGVPLALRRAVVRTTTVRLEFAGLTAELPRREYERYKGSTDWGVEIPPSSWHPLKG
jgi:ABC-type Fe3+/spermidine/putrescine transport system ATPase subunit